MRNNHLIAVDGHADLHSEHGPNRGEHSGRSIDPTIKVTDLAWLEFEKPDLDRAEAFARAFGFRGRRARAQDLVSAWITAGRCRVPGPVATSSWSGASASSITISTPHG